MTELRALSLFKKRLGGDKLVGLFHKKIMGLVFHDVKLVSLLSLFFVFFLPVKVIVKDYQDSTLTIY